MSPRLKKIHEKGEPFPAPTWGPLRSQASPLAYLRMSEENLYVFSQNRPKIGRADSPTQGALARFPPFLLDARDIREGDTRK